MQENQRRFGQLRSSLEDVAQVLPDASSDDPATIRLTVQLANMMVEVGSFEKAERLFSAVLNIQPTHMHAAIARIDTVARGGNKTRALELAQQGRDQFPNAFQFVQRVGNLSAGLGEHGAAVQAYEQLVALKPNDAQARYDLGLSKFNSGDMAAARIDFREAVKSSPKRAAFWHKLIVASERLAEDSSALADAEGGLSHLPLDVPLTIFKARALIHLSRREECITVLQERLQKEPQDPSIGMMLGNVLLDHGCSEQAEDAFRFALNLNPGHEGAQLGIVRSLEMRNDEEGAMQFLEKLGAKDA